MNRFFPLILIAALLAGCGQPLTSMPQRPDQLQFPPLEFSFPAVERQQLANGIKVYLKEDHELPLVEISLLVGGGNVHDPFAETGLSQLFAQVLESGGTLSASPAELEAELEAMAAELSVSSSSYSYGIDLSLHRRDLRRGLEILAELLRRPRFDQERLELAKRQMVDAIRRKNDDPKSVSGRLLAQAVYRQHPFGSYPRISTVESFTREHLLQMHRRYFRPDNLWFAVSGAVEQSELFALLNDTLGGWQAAGSLDLSLPPLPEAPHGRIISADKQIPQTSILMGHPGISKDNPDLFALRVANYILGGGGFNSRMMREIRSNRGLAYSAYSYFQVGQRLPELFIASSETKAESTLEVVQLMRRLIQELIDQPVSEAELELAKQSLINSFVFAFTDSHSVVSRKLRLDFYDYPDQYLETYRQKLAAVTVADVQRVAKTYLQPQRLQIVLVGDSDRYAEAIKALELPLKVVELTGEE